MAGNAITVRPAGLQIIELGFMDNTVEIGQLSKPEAYMRVASLLAEGIEGYYAKNK